MGADSSYIKPSLYVRNVGGLEDFLKNMGESSCKFLSYVAIAEKFTGHCFDLVAEASRAVDSNWIYYNKKNPNDVKNFFVNDGVAILRAMTGVPWVETQVSTLPAVPPKYYIEGWGYQNPTKGHITHFKLPDWDPLLASVTVKVGKIEKYCLLTPLAA